MTHNEDTPNFSAIHKSIAESLLEGVTQRKHPFHIITIATINQAGLPDARSVVLRHFDHETRILGFHTDMRSPKVKEIQSTPNITLLCYSPEDCVQLRIQATATIHHRDRITEKAWNNTRPFSRKCYCITEAPGSKISTPTNALPEALIHNDPSDEESARAYEHISVIHCHYHTLDYLKLRGEGHYRALFTWDNEQLTETWLVP